MSFTAQFPYLVSTERFVPIEHIVQSERIVQAERIVQSERIVQTNYLFFIFIFESSTQGSYPYSTATILYKYPSIFFIE